MPKRLASAATHLISFIYHRARGRRPRRRRNVGGPHHRGGKRGVRRGLAVGKIPAHRAQPDRALYLFERGAKCVDLLLGHVYYRVRIAHRGLKRGVRRGGRAGKKQPAVSARRRGRIRRILPCPLLLDCLSIPKDCSFCPHTTSNARWEFADAARDLRKTQAVGQVYQKTVGGKAQYQKVVTDYGVHIMYFASVTEAGEVSLYSYTRRTPNRRAARCSATGA